VKRLLWVGAGLVAFLSALIFPVLPVILQSLVIALGATWQILANLIVITLISILVASFFAPLEALGWWAGWYGDEIETTQHPGSLVEPFPTDLEITRYVVYLDGISQARFTYLPEVERFLDALAIDLPDNIVLIKGIMSYSVLNKPLTEDRLMAFFWRLADRLQMNPRSSIIGGLIAATINIRNVLIVSVSADQRYGPIYNQGTAQLIHNSLMGYGYQPGMPLTLIGYSGGGQMAVGAAPYLKRSLKAPIELISLSGVISGNQNVLQLEHLYHLVGGKDLIEKVGPVMFPRRWKLFALSYWNRAKRRGKISLISLGSQVGHNGADGPYGDQALLPDGRTYLQQTVQIVSDIIQDKLLLGQTAPQIHSSNYDRYQQSPFNRPGTYPLHQSVDPDYYRPIAPWMGRLILPAREQRSRLKGVFLEVHHAPPEYQYLVGHNVILRWSREPQVRSYLRAVTKDVHFSEDALYSQKQGNIHPYRIDHWQQVGPLESLAGARPNDDVIVRLKDPGVTEGAMGKEPSVAILTIAHEPVQITGRFYGLVQFLESSEDALVTDVRNRSEMLRVVHFDRASRQFNGLRETICIPKAVFDQHHGSHPSTLQDITKSPANVMGWYIYGAKDASGKFVVQSIAPRQLLRLQPDQVIEGKAAWTYLKQQAWKDLTKGTIRSVLLHGVKQNTAPSRPPVPSAWIEGDRALLVHVYGGIGGKKKEPTASSPIFFGHFAYGVATVIQEPLADELMFDIEYHQVYTHNTDGIIAGTIAWNRFLGDRQFGWLGRRPVCDLLIKLNVFTEGYAAQDAMGDWPQLALDSLIAQLEVMTARYRIGDGTGGTYVGAAHNCSQDSNQALYAALKDVQKRMKSSPDYQELLRQNPAQEQQFQQIVRLSKTIRRELMPFGTARADWQTEQNSDGQVSQATLGISPEEDAFQNIRIGLISWRTLLPRLASETIAKLFLEQGASIWVLRANQVGGYDPDIQPIAPTQIGW
jgi:predicted Abi (CAAX) family protease